MSVLLILPCLFMVIAVEFLVTGFLRQAQDERVFDFTVPAHGEPVEPSIGIVYATGSAGNSSGITGLHSLFYSKHFKVLASLD